MDKNKAFAKNLEAIRKQRGMSLSAFANELGIPKSTLQSVLADGQTTLDTALRISQGLNIPLDALTNGALSEEKFFLTHALMMGIDWFRELSPDEQKNVAFHLHGLLEALRK